MNIDNVLWLSGSAAEAVVIILLVYRRMWRTFPIFFAYSVWTLLANAVLYAIFRRHVTGYVTAYLVFMVLDSVLLFGVLVELGVSVLRPLRASLPRATPLAVGILIFALGAAVWPFATIPGMATLPREMASLMHLQQTISVLRVLLFLILAGCSQLLSIGWRNRELQIATGLGLYSLVGVVVTVLHTYPALVQQYNRLDQLVVAGYLVSLVYWIVSFAQQEQERREFSPQMQSLLLAVAGAARTARASLEETGSGKGGMDRKP